MRSFFYTSISILSWFIVLIGLPPYFKNRTVGSSNVAKETINVIFVEKVLGAWCKFKASVWVLMFKV